MNIFMMGDSIMKTNNYFTFPQHGWGQALQLFVNEGVVIQNFAENGRSTKSFIGEGRFDALLSKLEAGDFVICGFAHNDEKAQDPARYTEPYGTFTQNLAYFAAEVEKKGAHIVFTTPVIRHKFVDGVCVNTHGDYPQAIIDYCKSSNHTCVDLFNYTLDLYNKIGETQSSKFHMILPASVYPTYPDGKDDHSHLLYEGAIMVAQAFVNLVYKTNDPIKSVLIDLNSQAVIDWNMLID